MPSWSDPWTTSARGLGLQPVALAPADAGHHGGEVGVGRRPARRRRADVDVSHDVEASATPADLGAVAVLGLDQPLGA